MRRKATRVCSSGGSNPEWNEVLMFNIPPEVLPHVELQLVVMETDLLSRDRIIGVCKLGAFLPGTPGSHWRIMLAQQTQPVAMWHFLSTPIFENEEDL